MRIRLPSLPDFLFKYLSSRLHWQQIDGFRVIKLRVSLYTKEAEALEPTYLVSKFRSTAQGL